MFPCPVDLHSLKISVAGNLCISGGSPTVGELQWFANVD